MNQQKCLIKNLEQKSLTLNSVIKKVNMDLKKNYSFDKITLLPLSKARTRIATLIQDLNPLFNINSNFDFKPRSNYDGKLWHYTVSLDIPINQTFSECGSTKKQAELRLSLSVMLWMDYIKAIKHLNNHELPDINKNKIGGINIENPGMYENFYQHSRSYCTDAKSKNENNNILNKQSSTNINNNLSILFTNPKNVLNKVYEIVSKELKCPSFKLNPYYYTEKKSKAHWCCSYKIKWPNEESFTATAINKKESSKRCAAIVLSYLYDQKAIDKNGQPILYSKEQIIQDDHLFLSLTDEDKLKMEEVITLHKEKMMPILTEERRPKMDGNFISKSNEKRDLVQKKYSFEKYRCAEKMLLPISHYREQFINLLKDHSVVIVKGEPGCGKSTRIPQYILESWAQSDLNSGKPCKIAVTQPRRIAAISLAERVAFEREERVGDIVGYQVRFNKNFSPYTGKILYCTGGTLLRHLQTDSKLSQFSHIVLDEAHERDISTDILMALLRKNLKENSDLKVVVMSATIDTDLFQNYFDDSSVMHVPGLVYPVKSYFVDQCKSINLGKTMEKCRNDDPTIVPAEVAQVLRYIHSTKPEGAILCFLPGWEEIRTVKELLGTGPDFSVLCLHSRIKDFDQQKIFKAPPPGVRKIILATNIAETSVTVSDVKYVVDTGTEKDQRFDSEKGVMCMDNHWISQASMTQRKGRAGRTQGGECYHLYPKENLSLFPKYSLPEILRSSLTKVVLDSKIYTDKMKAFDFFNDLPTPPGDEALKLALDELRELELIDDLEHLTPLGKLLADFQLEPKLAKTLVNSVIFKCITPIVDIVTLFSLDTNLFENSLNAKDEIKNIKSKFRKTSDHLAMMLLFEKWIGFKENGKRNDASNYCQQNYLLESKLSHIESLASVHFGYLENGLKSIFPLSDDFSDHDELIKAVLFSGVNTFLQLRNWDIVKGQIKKNKTLLTRLNHKATITLDSVNSKKSSFPSNILFYINETRSNIRRITLVRESSVIPLLTVLLFSNKELKLHNISSDKFSKKLNSDNQVLLELKGTKIKTVLDKKDALLIVNLKLVINTCYDYYIYQLTEGGQYRKEINELWNIVLKNICDILNSYKTE